MGIMNKLKGAFFTEEEEEEIIDGEPTIDDEEVEKYDEEWESFSDIDKIKLNIGTVRTTKKIADIAKWPGIVLTTATIATTALGVVPLIPVGLACGVLGAVTTATGMHISKGEKEKLEELEVKKELYEKDEEYNKKLVKGLNK